MVSTTTDTDLLLHLGQTLGQMDLTISNTRATRVYNEGILQHVLRFLLTLCDTPFHGDETYWKRKMGKVVLEMEVMQGKPDHPPEGEPEVTDGMTRIEWVMNFLPRLWRGARVTMMRILSRMFAADRDFQLELGECHQDFPSVPADPLAADKYAANYHILINHLIARDREPEYALVLWGTHLLSRPDFALTAVWKQDILCVFARVLTSYFSDQKVAGHGLIMPPRPVTRIMPESEGFKSKKWQVMFKHLKITLRQPAVQQWLVNNANSQRALIDFIWLWRSVSSFLRQVQDHVEYENDVWMRVVTVVVDLASITQAFGRSFTYGSITSNLAVLRNLEERIVEHHRTVELSVPGEAWAFIPVRFGDYCRNVMAVTVGKSPASPFNPLHWLMAEIIRQTGGLYTMAIKSGAFDAMRKEERNMWVTPTEGAEEEVEFQNLLLMEKPLQCESNSWSPLADHSPRCDCSGRIHVPIAKQHVGPQWPEYPGTFDPLSRDIPSRRRL